MAHLSDALVHVLKVNTEHIVLNDLRVVILDDVLAIELLVPIYLLLHRFYFLLVKTEVRVHQLNHFDRESLSCIYVERFVDFTGSALAQNLTHLPLNVLAVDPFTGSHRAI